MHVQPRQVKQDVKTVLIFEPDQTSLEKLSVFLKEKGFRVLSTQRPEGVEFRFNNWPKPDLLIISAHKQLRGHLKYTWLYVCKLFLETQLYNLLVREILQMVPTDISNV